MLINGNFGCTVQATRFNATNWNEFALEIENINDINTIRTDINKVFPFRIKENMDEIMMFQVFEICFMKKNT